MDRDEPYYVPAQRAGYTPYLYEAGVFSRYPVPPVVPIGHPSATSVSPLERAAGYALTTTIAPQTVEEVIARGYFAVPYANPITALISDKLHTSRLGLNDVIHQIRSRYEIYARNIEELNESVCEVNNGLFRQLADHGMLVATQRQMYSVTKAVQKLYEEQREERINLWRDISRLKLEFPEAIQQYLAAYRKQAILAQEAGDVE
jgi:hypothetical protein